LREKVPIWIDQAGDGTGVRLVPAADGAAHGAGGSAVLVIGAALALAGPIIPGACNRGIPVSGLVAADLCAPLARA